MACLRRDAACGEGVGAEAVVEHVGEVLFGTATAQAARQGTASGAAGARGRVRAEQGASGEWCGVRVRVAGLGAGHARTGGACRGVPCRVWRAARAAVACAARAAAARAATAGVVRASVRVSGAEQSGAAAGQARGHVGCR